MQGIRPSTIRPRLQPTPTPTRVIATLDFTRLRDLLAEEFDVDELLRTVPLDAGAGPEELAVRKKKPAVKTIDSIRRRNVNGRELDWSLLEPLIRRISVDADTPVPTDPHGTHVAGILAAAACRRASRATPTPFVGVCPDIQLYDLRVFGEDQGEQAGGDEFTILAALDYISWANRDPERPTIHGVNLSLSTSACGRRACVRPYAGLRRLQSPGRQRHRRGGGGRQRRLRPGQASRHSDRAIAAPASPIRAMPSSSSRSARPIAAIRMSTA